MKRRPSKHLRPARPLASGTAALEHKSDGTWVVRTVPGAKALKAYTCPGCAHPIGVGTAHVVAWPHEATTWTQPDSLVEQRRHWHTACWRRRR